MNFRACEQCERAISSWDLKDKMRDKVSFDNPHTLTFDRGEAPAVFNAFLVAFMVATATSEDFFLLSSAI